jgi:hypothetical protein
MITRIDKTLSRRLDRYSFRCFSLLLLTLLPLTGAGCVTASLVTAGTVVGAATAAVSTGADVYRLGKLDTAVMANYDDTREAVREAAANFRLKIVRDQQERKHYHIWNFELADDLKETVDVRIERRSDELCLIRVDVGWFGSQPTAQLIIDKIRSHLPSTALPISNT